MTSRAHDVYLAFYTLKHSKLNIFKKLYYRLRYILADRFVWDIPRVHIEIIVDGYSYSINQEEKEIHSIKQKQYRNDNYEIPLFRHFVLNDDEYIKLLTFIQNHKKNEGYDSWSDWYFIPIIGRCIPQSKKEWFCSKFVATALEYSSSAWKCYIKDPEHMTPEDIYVISLHTCNSVTSLDIRSLGLSE